MDKNNLIKLIETSISLREIATKSSISITTVRYWIKKFNLHELYIRYAKYVETNSIPIKYSKQNLELIVSTSNSIEECYTKLNVSNRGSGGGILPKYIKLYNIDISHFKKKELSFYHKERYINVESLLYYGNNIHSNSLKKKLYKEGYKTPICELCGQDENWNGKKIAMILDHIDGNSRNNNLCNLQIVCPNCNAGLDTFAGKNTKRAKELRNKV